VVQHAGKALLLAFALAPRRQVAHDPGQRLRPARLVQQQGRDHFHRHLAPIRTAQLELARHAQARTVARGKAAQAFLQAGAQGRQRALSGLLTNVHEHLKRYNPAYR
jgi:transposase